MDLNRFDMIDNFSIALTHGLLLIAVWRLIHRPDLDRQEDPPEHDKEPEGFHVPSVHKESAGMRDLVFVAYLAGLLFLAFKRPFVFTLVYAYVDIIAPQRLSYFLLNSACRFR